MKEVSGEGMKPRTAIARLAAAYTDPAIVINDRYEVEYANDAAVAHLAASGWSRELGAPCYRLLHGRDTPCPDRPAPLNFRCPMAEALETSRSVRQHHVHLDADGLPHWTETTTVPWPGEVPERSSADGPVALVRRVIQVQRTLLPSEGQACPTPPGRTGANSPPREESETLAEPPAPRAAAVTHDLRNLLGTLCPYVSLAQRVLPADTPAKPYLEGIRDAAQNAVRLVGELFHSVREDVAPMSPLALSDALRHAVEFLRPSLPHHVHVELSLASTQAVMLDRDLVRQSLVNLLLNAAEALDARPGGVEISTRDLPPDDPLVGRWLGHVEYGAVLWSTRDTGPGMPPHVARRVFEPFFSTKAERGGTGLGLASVRATVVEAGGSIWVESREGEGTTFHILLPMARPPRQTREAPNLPAPARASLGAGPS